MRKLPIVAFLLGFWDPLENHGLGSRFAEKLLSSVFSKSSTLLFSGVDFSRLKVERERSGLTITFFGADGEQVKKNFGSGVSRFLEKEILISSTEKDQVEKIISRLNEAIIAFDKIIETGISEYARK